MVGRFAQLETKHYFKTIPKSLHAIRRDRQADKLYRIGKPGTEPDINENLMYNELTLYIHIQTCQ